MEENEHFFQDGSKSTCMEKMESTFGSKLMFLMHVACGQHLNLPTPRWKLNPALKIIIGLFGGLIFVGVAFFVAISGYILGQNLHDFENAVLLTGGFFGFLQCFLRFVYTTVRKRKIEGIAEKVHRALNRHALGTGSEDFNKRLSWTITALLIVWSSSFAFAVFSIVTVNLSGVTVNRMLHDFHANETDLDHTMRVEMRLSYKATVATTKLMQNLGLRPSILTVKCVMGALFASCYWAIGRLVVSDVLFYSWYSVIVYQYQQLIDCLPEAIADGGKKLKYWAHYHANLNELLREVNTFTAPVILVSVVFTGIKICICSFVIFKLHNNMSVLPFVAFGLASLQQVFIYCVLGQALQNKIENLNAKAYKCSWLEGKGGMQGAAFMICLAGNERSGCKLPGTPFFPMSLQFFVSIIGVVFTYFIVLLQLN